MSSGGSQYWSRSFSALVFTLAVLSATPAVGLNLAPPHGRHVPVMRVPEPALRVTHCDLAAADPADAQKVVPGVNAATFNAHLALTQCSRAVQLYPFVARFHYQLGRARLSLGDKASALQAWRQAAGMGSMIAAFSAGVLYRDADLPDRDYNEANRLFQLCAARGDANCLNALGFQYQAGLGMKADPAKAAELYTKAAEAGLADAAISLGLLYKNGEGVQRDYAQAVRFFEIAEKQGNAQAYRHLATLYHDGTGIPQDRKRALEYWHKAADAGDDDALVKLAYAYFTGAGATPDPARSFAYYYQAAERGNSDGMAGLAYAYANGQGTAANQSRAAEWLIKALASGNEYSREQLLNHWNDWNREMRIAIQSLLKERGLYGGALDGTLNWQTRRAIEKIAGKG